MGDDLIAHLVLHILMPLNNIPQYLFSSPKYLFLFGDATSMAELTIILFLQGVGINKIQTIVDRFSE